MMLMHEEARAMADYIRHLRLREKSTISSISLCTTIASQFPALCYVRTCPLLRALVGHQEPDRTLKIDHTWLTISLRPETR